MYIDKLDTFCDKMLDDFFSTTSQKNKIILEDKNFIKFQKEINDTIINYYKSIDFDQLNDILINKDNTFVFSEYVKKYLMMYMFFYIAFHYTSPIDIYTSNIIEFSKNQPGYNLKINNFFNSSTNAQIINSVIMIKHILEIFTIFDDEHKLKLLSKQINYKNAFVFLNELGKDIVVDLVKNKNLQDHNLIKILIIDEYRKNDKKELSQILENTTNDNEEYTYIDVVVPSYDVIDFSTIESLLTRKEIVYGYANIYWDYLMENQSGVKKFKFIDDTAETKIIALINSGLLMPVLDDFLLYHKDSERYDKNMDTSTLKDFKKREETKIKYIVSKIDRSSDLHNIKTKDTTEIMKNFFAPLHNRKAVLVNIDEDIQLISKLINQGTKVVESNEYFNELANYKVYPYINFKDFKEHGFSIQFTKTVTALRHVSTEKKGEFRQNNSSPIQLRIGSKNEYVNIVGFFIPSNTNPVECHKVKDIKNVHEYGPNGYNTTLAFVNEGTIRGNEHKSSIVWLFNPKTDVIAVDKYEGSQIMSNETEQIKNLIAHFYDDVLTSIVNEFNRKIKSYDKISIQKARQILENIENRSIKINRNLELYNDIEELIINIVHKKEEKYDTYEDVFHGIGKDIVELPNAKKIKNKSSTTKTNVSKEKEDETKIEIEKIDGICQHNITWDHILRIKKDDPSKYQNKLYEFIQTYVTENNSLDFICKSCGSLIDVKKFVTDGTFNDDGDFVTFSMPMDIPLENLPEYEKYKISIRNIDKLIEKIAFISNIPAYIGDSFNARSKRKTITQNLIDIVNENNYFLRKDFKSRKENATKLYGIARDLTNLFVFDMDNNIFVFSSKEKDYYKNIKYNNIIAYIICLLCLDISESNLSYINGDVKGFCNFAFFDKHGHTLFENLRIRKNKNGDVVPMKRYMILCYMMFIMSCVVSKYSMWFYETNTEKEKASGQTKSQTKNQTKNNIVVQKSIIHTSIDIMNSILENGTNIKAGNILEIINAKYFLKMDTFFGNEDIYTLLKSGHTDDQSKKIQKSLHDMGQLIKLDDYTPMKYDEPIYNKYLQSKFYPKKKSAIYFKFDTLNKNTNCDDGEYHKWGYIGGVLSCITCKKQFEDNDTKTNVDDKYRTKKSKKLSQKYCISGSTHKIDDSGKSCLLCNKPINHEYSENQLEDLRNNIYKNKLEIISVNNVDDKTEKKSYINSLEKLTKQFNKYKQNDFSFIDEFITGIEHYFGDNVKDILVHDNIYIINHNYDGSQLSKPIILNGKENRVQFKPNHPFYKKDVLYYSFNKSGTNKIEVYYDAISKTLLGYKESSKEYTNNNKTDNKLKINYSLYHKLKYLGFKSSLVNMQHKLMVNDGVNMFSKQTEKEKEEYILSIISDFCSTRVSNLKNIIQNIQRIFNRIKNEKVYGSSFGTNDKTVDKTKNYYENKSYDDSLETPDDSANNDIDFELILRKYTSKITGLNLDNIFVYWRDITDNLFSNFNKSKNDVKLNTNSKAIDIDGFIEYDTNSNMLLFYIVEQLEQLVTQHQNKFVKSQLVSLIVEVIDHSYHQYNMDTVHQDINAKKLLLMLYSSMFIDNFENELTEMNCDNKNDDDCDKDDVIADIDVENLNDEQLQVIGENDDIREENDANDFDDFNKDFEDSNFDDDV